MLNGRTFYHATIKKTIVAFGRLFSGIKIEREGSDGAVAQTIAIPISYSNKEKWIVRIDSDPNLNNTTYTTLPRMAFEITGYTYDASRKMNRMNKIKCTAAGSSRPSMFTPVPYNIDVSLYVLTKTQGDALQIIEQILPTFTPEYSLSINAVPEMEVVQDVPVILNSITVQDDYDGDFQTRRFVTHTLSFTLKVNLYGQVSSGGIITTVIASLPNQGAVYTAAGTVPGDPITENWVETF
ncbi:tail sheath stabilizer and completion protein [uncultured Caudovirales phage]|uniref:Tail sheath stabilizer and completion protein n=1 Tax=uncultured Caudovirales phage TaxID=2100421 RepID=A0A6J5PP39_9CAUD|nr:tail sheath stabilizer and completion protein [uncultured Caudovirales phage]CAB4170985.1 tail sheath stabilizer and completion protein [uncultured Caudovirales phage]CAB4176249.1 tail sheath stabilizer and completion protein [uncultured Caudovirales phage]CAB4223041.1 tail sheath stabilizer and completion protein [uncultured Caudovirales phage]